MKYIYSVVRFVPDPVRGEFVNVGAIVGSDESSEWQLRTITSNKRVRALDENRLLSKALSFSDNIARKLDLYSDAIERDLAVSTEISEEWLLRLYSESRNVVQFSPPAPLTSDSLETAMEMVFSQFILEVESESRSYQSKHSALRAVRHAYSESGLTKGRDFSERSKVKGRVHSERFDFSVLNGRVVQLVQAWSFQIPDQEELAERIKAWAFTVEDLRANGGEALIHQKNVEILKDVDIAALYIPAMNEQDSVQEEALSAFRQVDVAAVPIAQVDALGSQANSLLHAAGHKILGLGDPT